MSTLPNNDDEEDAAPLNTGSDVVNLDVDYNKLIKGVRSLLKQNPSITKPRTRIRLKNTLPRG
jgi:hypothetical protein